MDQTIHGAYGGGRPQELVDLLKQLISKVKAAVVNVLTENMLDASGFACASIV